MSYPLKKLWELCNICTWRKDANFGTEDWKYPFFTCSSKVLKAPDFSFDTDAILIAGNGDVWACKRYKWKFEAYQRTYVLDNFQEIEKDFLFYFLEWNLKRELLSETLWSAIPYIKLWSLKNREIPLPPLPTQKLIVQKLDEAFARIDASIELAEKSLKAIEEGNASVLEEVFWDSDYSFKKLKDIITLIMWQSPKSETYNRKWIWIPFFQWKKEFWLIYPIPEVYCSVPIRIAKEWDILMSVRAPVWPTNIANQDCCIWRWLCAIRANIEIIEQNYLLYYLKKIEIEIAALGKWSTFSSITKSDLENLKIPLPPLSKQKEIVEYLDRVFAVNTELKWAYEEKIQSLKELKQSLLREAFEGRLVKE